MKIGLVSPYSFSAAGGVQNHILGLANWLITRGHQVKIAGPDADQVGTDLGRSIPIRFNGSTARIILKPFLKAQLTSWASELDLVHIHEPLVPMVGWQAAKLQKPVVVTCHAAVNSRLHHITTPLFRQLKLTSVIAVSEVAALTPAAAGAEVTIIGNGAAIELRDEAKADLRVSFVGRRDDPRKGFDIFVKAMSIVRESFPDVEVCVIGQGKDRPADFKYFGSSSDAERDQILATTTVFVAPNTGNESFGMILLEALAAGTDIVASDISAFRNLLTDQSGPVARLVPVKNAALLATAINDALRNGPISPLIRRQKLAEKYDWAVIGSQIEDFYSVAAQKTDF